MRALIAGAGIISAIGQGVGQTLTSLKSLDHGARFDQRYVSASNILSPVAEVKYSNEELAAMAGAPENWPRTALLGMIATREAVSGFPGLLEGTRSGLISAGTVGGMDRTEAFFREFRKNKQKGRLRDVVHHECGSVTELIAGGLGINTLVTTISTACSSSSNSISLASRLISQGYLDVALAGGADALTSFTFKGFNSLMILDREHCKPFDADRKGLNIGEGAAYLLLVSEKIARDLGIHALGYVSGYGNANDAFHQTASSPEGRGSYDAMSQALTKAGIEPDQVDYINLHGTGTMNNDASEGKAIERLFGSKVPWISSTKQFTGHTLGACGSVEAVISLLAIRHGLVFPNLNFIKPMEETPLVPVTSLLENQEIHTVLSNSFGFGGFCSSLIITKN